jgi:putative hydrolase of the HAD superfamily
MEVTMQPVRAVLFDLGGTLYDYGELGPGNFDEVVEVARAAGIEADRRELARAHLEALRKVYRDYLPRPFYLHRDMFREAVIGMGELLGVTITEEHLANYGRMRSLDEPFIYREGAEETLQALNDRGLHMGIVSNIDADQLERIAARAGLERYFHWLLSSEEAGSCKPDQGIFQEALRRAGCAPHEALFIGDSLDADVAGSNAAGMRSVLLWHRTDREPPDRDPRPHHVVRRIPDVLDLVDGAG